MSATAAAAAAQERNTSSRNRRMSCLLGRCGGTGPMVAARRRRDCQPPDAHAVAPPTTPARLRTPRAVRLAGMRQIQPTIVVIGFMGAGKTSVGRLVARALGREFIDTDLMIERATPMTLAGRLTGVTDRPLLKDASDRAGHIRDLLVARGPIYETAGDVAIDTDRHNVEQVAVEVMDWYRRRVGAMAGR